MKAIMLLLAAALAASVANAQVPRTINYQGVLTNAAGTPLTSPPAVAMTFALFTAPTSGALLWKESQSVNVTNGVLDVTLGTGTLVGGVALQNLTFDAPYFLEINAGGETLSPRGALKASPYAFRAVSADSLGTGASIAGAQITGPITTATIGGAQITGSISNAVVPGSQITGSISGSQITGAITGATMAGSQVTGAITTASMSGAQITGPITTATIGGSRITGSITTATIPAAQVIGAIGANGAAFMYNGVGGDQDQLSPMGNTHNNGANAVQSQSPMPFACTAGNFYVWAPKGPTVITTYTLLKEGLPTGITCSLPVTTVNTSCTDLVNTAAFAQGDKISTLVGGGAGAGTTVSISWRCR